MEPKSAKSVYPLVEESISSESNWFGKEPNEIRYHFRYSCNCYPFDKNSDAELSRFNFFFFL